MTNEEILNKQIESEKYYDIEDLRMNRGYNFLLSQKDLQSFLKFKEDNNSKMNIDISLKSWNSKKDILLF